jgi:hypothetical protein
MDGTMILKGPSRGILLKAVMMVLRTKENPKLNPFHKLKSLNIDRLFLESRLKIIIFLYVATYRIVYPDPWLLGYSERYNREKRN